MKFLHLNTEVIGFAPLEYVFAFQFSWAGVTVLSIYCQIDIGIGSRAFSITCSDSNEVVDARK